MLPHPPQIKLKGKHTLKNNRFGQVLIIRFKVRLLAVGSVLLLYI